MNNDKSKQIGIGIIILLVLIKFLLLPWFNWVGQKTATIKQQKFVLSRLEKVEFRSGQLSIQQEIIDAQYQGLTKLWESAEGSQLTISVARHLDSLAEKHNIQLQNRNTGTAQQSNGFNNVAVAMFAQGEPTDLLAFLYEVEQAKPKLLLVNGTFSLLNSRSTKVNANLGFILLLKPQGAAE